jgi:hypothetical protein
MNGNNSSDYVYMPDPKARARAVTTYRQSDCPGNNSAIDTTHTGNEVERGPCRLATLTAGIEQQPAAAVSIDAAREKLEALRDKPRFSCGGESHSLAIQANDAFNKGNVVEALSLAVESLKLDSEIEKAEIAAAASHIASQAPAVDDKPASHSPDFRSVNWFGMPYTFTTNQAKCIAILWRAWENGTPDVGGAAVVTDADAPHTRFVDVFKSKGKMHPAWNTMIVSQAKGAYRLADHAAVVSTDSRKTPRKTPRKKNRAK